MRDVISRERLRHIPSQPGVYLMTGRDPETAEPRVLYAGKSVNLRRRLASYRSVGSDRAARRLVRLAFSVDSVSWETVADDHAARLRENFLLRLHRPRFNAANTHPESHWYAVVRPGEGWLELARTRTPRANRACFGAFKQSPAFPALLRALWVALNPGWDNLALPLNLFGAKSRNLLRFELTEFDGEPARCQTLLHQLTGYLDGSSSALGAWLRERLAPVMGQNGFMRAWLTADLELVDEFFTRVTRRNAELRRRFGITGTVVSKEMLDDLLVLAQATGASREHFARGAVPASAESSTACVNQAETP